MKDMKTPPRIVLTFLFSAMVFAILAITMLIIGSIVFLLAKAGLFERMRELNVILSILVLALASMLVGTVVGAVLSRIPLRPVNVLISGMARLASGDYAARIDLGKFSIAQKLSESFNALAAELQNTEMLRSDFVNNFSHEFKTPIVSIRGFAKLLQKGSLQDEQRREYLAIIVEESTRLSDMATSVLNLAKIENQSILTDLSRFNLSEQIRNCILLLEKKWTKKGLTMIADFDEHYIVANEEMLKQVWINLIDNAVKFSPEAGEIGISIAEVPGAITVSVKNNGAEISRESMQRIFHKFYQGDASHSSEGTGLGLAIVKRIVDLHKGSISVASSPEETVFSVKLSGEFPVS
ncbi:MAG TPA: HAMP domain-containing sensor histidine kinase [Clostridia bacterium]|nr:HAMP domain-containing sensor histidine kinase [Clostridia bacterium]